MDMKDITVEELKKRKEAGDAPILIDVREPNEREAFHIGGELIPLGTLATGLKKFEDRKDEEIVVYCRSGARSGRARNMMLGAGFSRVRNLEGGVLAWIDAFGTEGD